MDITTLGAALALAKGMDDKSADQRSRRVSSLTPTPLAYGTVVEAIGIPVYVSDVTQYSAYGLTDTGWYVFARIAAKGGTVGAQTTVTGAAGAIIESGADHIDVAVRFGVEAYSQTVVVNWGESSETFVFKASDLAVRNLDYRTTFYVYDIAQFVTWSYALTTDTTFADGKNYYTKSGDVYTLAEVTVGDPVSVLYELVDSYVLTTDTTFQAGTTYYTKDGDTYTEATVTPGEAVTADTYYVLTTAYARTTDTTVQEGKTYYTLQENVYTEAEVTVGDPVPAYYNHSKVTFAGMTRNVTYRLDDMIDCPIEIVLPTVADDGYGAWFEIQLRYNGEYSCTLVPTDASAKIGTTQTQQQKAGINVIDLQYSSVGGAKLWTLLNTHSDIPAAAQEGA